MTARAPDATTPPPAAPARASPAQARVQARAQAAPSAGRAGACHCRACGAADAWGALWWTRIPGRAWSALIVLTAPLRAIVWILDGLVAASVVGVLVLGWAWWTERITDDQVAQVLGRIGGRGLSILTRSGIL